MLSEKEFSILKEMPKTASSNPGGMHPDTERIIKKIKTTKGKVLAVKLKSSREAKNRLDALRRAKARRKVVYKEARRKAETLYVRMR